MSEASGYVFLDIDDPLCAWCAYRGVLVCAPDRPGFLSVWTAGRIRNGDPAKLALEFAVESVRAAKFPNRVSRLRGMFCLTDLASVHRVGTWGAHFQSKYLAEVTLTDAGAARDRLDANWITNAKLDDHSWIDNYWAGMPYPHDEPIWETIVGGRMIVLGTDLRQRAYNEVKSVFPDSLALLEIGRLAALVGSDLGSIANVYEIRGNRISITFGLNMEDADNPEFLKKLQAAIESGQPFNRADARTHIDRGTFGTIPDFRCYDFHQVIEAA